MQNLINKYIEISSEEEMQKATNWLTALGYKNPHSNPKINKETFVYLFIGIDKHFQFDDTYEKSSHWKPFSVLYEEGMPWDKEEDLVSKAKRLYPIGTQYKCAAVGDGGDFVNTVESMDWAPSPAYTVYGEDGKGCIYYKGKWAEIVHEVKPIEKWSVGSYVVFFNNSTCHNVKVGTIDKIKYNIDKVGDAWFEDYGCCDRSRLDVDVKWFATLEEAEIFSKSLQQPIEEKWKPKVGDWVVTDNLSNGRGGMYEGNLGQVWQIGKIINGWYSPVDSMEFIGGSLQLHNLRKATSSEINSVCKKEEILTSNQTTYQPIVTSYSYNGVKETHQSINIAGKKFSPIKAELIKVKQLKIN